MNTTSKNKVLNQGIVVLLPTDQIPSPLVIQAIDGLQKMKEFNRVVLAGGLK